MELLGFDVNIRTGCLNHFYFVIDAEEYNAGSMVNAQ
jgi:hypothetical protein